MVIYDYTCHLPTHDAMQDIRHDFGQFPSICIIKKLIIIAVRGAVGKHKLSLYIAVFISSYRMFFFTELFGRWVWLSNLQWFGIKLGKQLPSPIMNTISHAVCVIEA